MEISIFGLTPPWVKVTDRFTFFLTYGQRYLLVLKSLSRQKPKSHSESQVNIFQFVCDRKESENHHSTSFEVVGWLVHLHLNYSKTFTFVFELRH